MNIAMLLEMIEQSHSNMPAFTEHGQSVSYGEFQEHVRRRAEMMVNEGEGVEHVLYLGIIGGRFVEHLFASAWAGLPLVPLNYRLRARELAGLIAPLQPAMTICDRELSEKAVNMTGDSDSFLLSEMPAKSPPKDAYSANPDAVAVLLHTSGTTSHPKAVLLRHRHLCAYLFGSVELGTADESEAVIVTVPPYHIAGVMAVLSNIYSGRRMVFVPNFDPIEWLQLATEEAATHAFLVPTMLARIVDVLERNPRMRPESLRHLAYGGGPATSTLVERAMTTFGSGVAFVNAYGLTETSSTVAVLGPEDHRTAFDEEDDAKKRLGSVGRALPNVTVAILDEGRQPLPAGHRGEIAIRGEQVSGEYRGEGSRTTREGYFRTGDVGYVDVDGYLYIDGRVDDMIIRGGENISPLEIENVLSAHAGVVESAVIGVPSEEWGQEVAAVVVPSFDVDVSVDELQRWVGERLGSYKVPRTIRFVEELPRTESGKVIRRDLSDVVLGEGSPPG